MPRDTTINLVATVFFNTDSSIGQLNIVYKVTFVSEILPYISFEKNVFDSGFDADLVIDARASRFSTFGNKNDDGLTFRWECEGNF